MNECSQLDLGLDAGGATHVLATKSDLRASKEKSSDAGDDNPGKDDQPVDPHLLAQASKVDSPQTANTIGERENFSNTEEAGHDDPVQDTARGGEHQDHEHGGGALEPIDGQDVREEKEDRDEGETCEPDEGESDSTVEMFIHLVAVEDLRHHPDEEGVDDGEHDGNSVAAEDDADGGELGDLGGLEDGLVGVTTEGQDADGLDGVGEVLTDTVDSEHASDVQHNELFVKRERYI